MWCGTQKALVLAVTVRLLERQYGGCLELAPWSQQSQHHHFSLHVLQFLISKKTIIIVMTRFSVSVQ